MTVRIHFTCTDRIDGRPDVDRVDVTPSVEGVSLAADMFRPWVRNGYGNGDPGNRLTFEGPGRQVRTWTLLPADGDLWRITRPIEDAPTTDGGSIDLLAGTILADDPLDVECGSDYVSLLTPDGSTGVIVPVDSIVPVEVTR